MTTKDAILKLANAVSGDTSGNVSTDVQALAVLAQAMTGGVPSEPLATVDDAIAYIADNYSGGGGVGTAKVAFTCTYTGDAFGIFMPLIYEGVIYMGTSSDEVDGTTFDVPIAENGTQVVLGPPTPDDVQVTVTGDIAIDDEGYLMVTGDGTVTLADKEIH